MCGISSPLLSQSGKPDVFVDCQTRCYYRYIIQEIDFINYLQDRTESDVYVLITSQNTGSGGEEIQLVFSGSNEYACVQDTFQFLIGPDATEAIERDLIVDNIKKGLLPVMSLSPLSDQINWTLNIKEEEKKEEVIDPWNYWVFNVGGNLNLRGESSFRSSNYSARFTASRITEQNKIRFNARFNNDWTKFILSDGEEFISIFNSYRLNLLYVKSLNDHWSIGMRSNAGSSTFGNTDFDASIKPAIEYNFFPYQEAQTKQFTVYYSIGPEFKNYTDTTVFDKIQETVFRHQVNINFEQTKEWGGIDISFGISQYLHNPSLYSTYFNPNLNWQVAKGLRLNFGGFLSFVRDRINIAKSTLSDQEILLQLKQLDTSFTYSTYVGLNYRFGSKYNNFVNPRF